MYSEGVVGHVKAGGCLGHSDHKPLWCNEIQGSRVVNLGFERPNFKLLRELVHSVPQETAFEELGVHESRSVFKNHLPQAQEWAIPCSCKVRQVGQKKLFGWGFFVLFCINRR